MHHRTYSIETLFSLALAVIAWSVPASADTFNIAEQYDPNNNPSSLGPWSYGSETVLGGPFTLYPEIVIMGPINNWASAGGTLPAVAHNSSASTFVSGTVRFLGGQAVLHPGPSGEISIFRFSVPSAGLYDIAVSFSGNDVFGTTTDVHVLLNNVSIFDDVVSSAWVDPSTPGAGPSFTTPSPLSLAAGDTIDFAVGFGNNGNFFNDTTGIDGTVALVESVIPGDVNGDGVVNLLDVAPFVEAISSGTFIPAADINGDGVVDLLDVQPFVVLLTG